MEQLNSTPRLSGGRCEEIHRAIAITYNVSFIRKLQSSVKQNATIIIKVS